jgi:murein hydrolase activator
VKRQIQLLFFAFIFCVPFHSYAQQSSEELESKRKKLEQEIAYTNQLIEQTRKSKQVTLNELKLIAQRISKRNDLIAVLKKEIDALDTKIEFTEIGINRLSNELEDLKKEYAKVILFAYKHQTPYNKLIYLFSADDLNQAYQRLRYLEQIGEYIRHEADTIRQKEKHKESELIKLNEQVSDKKKLLDNQNTQVSKLEREQILKADVKKKLTGKERQLKAELRDKEKEAKRLAKKIEEIIARETKSTKSGTGSDYALSPEEKQLSASFASNLGKLPWPLERGVISETFGVHQHPVLKNVKTKNNGLNINTSENEDVRAVFKGKVVSVAMISSSNIAVIIKHGEYFTVYSNLDKVYVKQGDDVDTKQLIGKVHTSLKGKTELNFQVWKGKEIQDPSKWILKR